MKAPAHKESVTFECLIMDCEGVGGFVTCSVSCIIKKGGI